MYERKSIHSIEEIEMLIKDFVINNHYKVKKVKIGRDLIKVHSDRYKTFFAKGYKCECCGIEGSFFAKEKHRGHNSNKYHLNLYGINDKGEEVLMTKDHILPKSKGGKDNISNYQTMCCICNERKGDIEMSWNETFNYFIELKNTIGGDFSCNKDFKELVKKYGTSEQYEKIESLQFIQHGELLLIRYGDYSNIFSGESDRGAYWDRYNKFYRECRSLVINLEKEELVLTPFKKFLNINENEENSFENISKIISNCESFEVSNKLDGSMVSARYYNGEYILSTSKGLDMNTSWRLHDAYCFLDENYRKMLWGMDSYTLIFEFISKEDEHVVKYDESQY